jgi:ketosteroid isomerase-like protein
MATKTDVLKERYERFGRGDLAGALDIWADDFVWDAYDTGLPGSGRHEGKQAAISVLQEAVGAFDRFELNINEFVEQGDTVVALGTADVAKGDRKATLPVVQIWTFRGHELVQFRGMLETLSAARILGIS